MTRLEQTTEATGTSPKADAVGSQVDLVLGAWQPIATAPRGSGEDGPELVTHPDYVAPPNLLLKHADGIAVGYYEWYYHPGYGRGASPDEPVWRSLPDYSGLRDVTHWMPMPAPPQSA